MIKNSPIPQINILIVDDDVTTRKILTKIIEKEGYNVISASSAETAIILIEKNKYHIIISDIMMPDMDGIELLEIIKKRDPLIQVVMLTSGVSMSKTLQALEHGATDFILKPIEPNEILMIIRLCEGKILRWWSIMKTTYNKKREIEKNNETI